MKNEMFAKSIPNRLKLFMKKKSVTGKEMANLGSVSEQAYSGYIQGKSLPAANTLAEWAKNTGMNINWLLTGEGDMLGHEGEVPASVTPDACARRIAELEEELKEERRLNRRLTEKLLEGSK